LFNGVSPPTEIVGDDAGRRPGNPPPSSHVRVACRQLLLGL